MELPFLFAKTHLQMSRTPVLAGISQMRYRQNRQSMSRRFWLVHNRVAALWSAAFTVIFASYKAVFHIPRLNSAQCEFVMQLAWQQL
jgi:hypothetical protein